MRLTTARVVLVSVLVTSTLMLTAGLSAPAAQRQSAPGPANKPWTQPRTPWGDPDFEGAWTSDNNFSVPLERPAEVADKIFLDGKDLENALAARARTIAAIVDGGPVGAGPPHWYAVPRIPGRTAACGIAASRSDCRA
jgi:hypothetical protein